MRKVSWRILFAVALLALSACTESRIEIVRNGTLEHDETRTLGDVLDNAALLSNGKWEAFDADDGSHVVQFSGKLRGLQEAMDQMRTEFEKNPAGFALGALAQGGEMGGLGFAMLVNSGIRIKECHYQVQFLMSKREAGAFQVGNATLRAKVKMPDGKVVEEEFDDEDDTILDGLYEGEKAGIAAVVVGKMMVSGLFKGILQEVGKELRGKRGN